MTTAKDRLEDFEHKVTGTPKHWESSPERKALETEYFKALHADILELLRNTFAFQNKDGRVWIDPADLRKSLAEYFGSGE